VREKVVVGQLRVIQVPSARQYADIMTKGLPSAIFDEFRSSLCIRFGHAATAGGGGCRTPGLGPHDRHTIA
jgi:hypothetical protein